MPTSNRAVRFNLGALLLTSLICLPACAKDLVHGPKMTMAELIKTSTSADWRMPDAENTLYMELEKGRVVIEMSPYFAPNHVANVKALIREAYFDGLSINRSQDNYVVQWSDATELRSIVKAKKTLPEEFSVRYDAAMAFTRLPDHDGFAAQVGHANGFPAARDPKTGRAWLAHCYGMVGAGRDNASDSGGGAELYAVIGHAPRHLDRNVTLFGRVIHGMELLSALPRGKAAMGFYDKPEQTVTIKSVRIAQDLPPAERSKLEILRTDTPLFKAITEAQRNLSGEWYKKAANYIDLCNVPVPVRVKTE
ncbi:peptidylprolyl isomerase [Undibacterium sp. Ren11W]|uniref:peptidylprolyl isomerase n=1 Tax=Undibacterium sp. Ren11W TaxID=3413045 RepID=UPI003BEF599F